jgi:aminopeptidase N
VCYSYCCFVEFKALSNMEETNVLKVNGNWSRTEFALTPLMSTYILAFVVCDFQPLETVGPNGLKVYG